MHRILPRLVAIAAAFVLAGCRDSGPSIDKGARFDSEAELMDAAKADGYVVMGRFNMDWPATIEAVQTARNEITIEVPGHGRHTYPGYDGYTLKALMMELTEGRRGGVVLRSEKK